MEYIEGQKILILGVGNILLSDEGFGVQAVNWLQNNYQWPKYIELLDGGTQGFMLIPHIQSCDILIVLDIVLGQEKAGTTYLLEGNDIRKSFSFHDSMHQTDLLDTLFNCELINSKPQTIVFGFEPFDYKTFNPEITTNSQKLLPQYCSKIISWFENELKIKIKSK